MVIDCVQRYLISFSRKDLPARRILNTIENNICIVLRGNIIMVMIGSSDMINCIILYTIIYIENEYQNSNHVWNYLVTFFLLDQCFPFYWQNNDILFGVTSIILGTLSKKPFKDIVNFMGSSCYLRPLKRNTRSS